MTCPHIITSGTSQHCSLAEQAVRERDAEIDNWKTIAEEACRGEMNAVRAKHAVQADRDRLAAENERLREGLRGLVTFLQLSRATEGAHKDAIALARAALGEG